jgi:hypothetical protein
MSRVIRRLLLLIGLGSALLLAPPARASELIRRSLSELARGAQFIFIGRCEAVSCHWNTDHSLILTANRFRILRPVKGDPGPSITLDELGGTVGEDTLQMSDVPRYRVGEEVLLCVRRTELGRWTTFGAGQGRFPIDRDSRGQPWVRSDFYPGELTAISGGRGSPGRAPLAAFVGHLQALAVSREGRS